MIHERYLGLVRDDLKLIENKDFWKDISCYQKLSEEFIREFQDKVNWSYISGNQKLSEEFIREFKEKLRKYQTLD